MGEESKNEKKSFIKEKIVRKTEAGKGFRNVIKIIAGAILFGIIAAGVFVISRPTAEKLLGSEPESTTAEIVTIPRDENMETSAETETEPETEIIIEETPEAASETEPTDEAETEEMESTEAIEDVVAGAMDNYQYTIEDLNDIWKNLAVLCNSVDSSVVTILPEDDDSELFSPDDEREYSGIAIAETYNETLILTLAEAADNGDDITVVWSNGNSQPGYIKQTDKITGLGIIFVKKSEMTETIKGLVKPVPLGNSYAVTRGDLLVAMGSPRSVVHSTDYAWTSYIEKNAHAVDGTSRTIYINNYLDNTKGTWVLNVNGELVGWSDKNNSGNIVTGISDYKSLIERMSNSREFPYLGVVPSSIPEELQKAGPSRVPKGAYVLEVINEAPAYEAGVLPGDIITGINDEEIHNAGEYSTVMDGLNAGDEINIVVQREARGEYRKLDYTVTVGNRNE